jgi:hypothetical protein
MLCADIGRNDQLHGHRRQHHDQHVDLRHRHLGRDEPLGWVVLGADAKSIRSVSHSLDTGESTSTAPLLIGSAVGAGGACDSWDGDIALPTVQQGVAILRQLDRQMRTGSPDA